MNPLLADILRDMEQESEPPTAIAPMMRETGQFLNILIKAVHAVSLLEVGTGNGYLTLCMADAVAANEGVLTTVEGNLWSVELAEKQFARSPHESAIRLVQGDPLEILPVLEGPFDFVLLDAEKSNALHFFHLIFDQLKSGALICCDKAISMAGPLADYLAYVHDRPGLESILVPVGEGIELTYKSP